MASQRSSSTRFGHWGIVFLTMFLQLAASASRAEDVVIVDPEVSTYTDPSGAKFVSVSYGVSGVPGVRLSATLYFAADQSYEARYMYVLDASGKRPYFRELGTPAAGVQLDSTGIMDLYRAVGSVSQVELVLRSHVAILEVPAVQGALLGGGQAAADPPPSGDAYSICNETRIRCGAEAGRWFGRCQQELQLAAMAACVPYSARTCCTPGEDACTSGPLDYNQVTTLSPSACDASLHTTWVDSCEQTFWSCVRDMEPIESEVAPLE